MSLLSKRAQVKSMLAEIATAVLFKPRLTETGVFRLMLEPSPSCPRLFLPQHLTEASSRIAQLWLLPLEIAIATLFPKSTVPLVKEFEPSPN